MAASAAYLAVVPIGCAWRQAIGGDSQRCGADCIVTVARHAGRRETRVVATFVTVAARQDTVNAGQRAADAIVIKACPGKCLLGVAVAASRPKRVVVHVIALVAADAQLGQPLSTRPLG